MIFKKLLGLVAAAAAIATAAVLCVVTLAFALFAALSPVIGAAWAYASVAAAALLVVAVALLATHRHKEKTPEHGDPDMVGQLFELARKRPLIAAAAAAAAGAVLLRNPGVLTGILAAYLGPKPPRKPR